MADRVEDLVIRVRCFDGEVFLIRNFALMAFELFSDMEEEGRFGESVKVKLTKDVMKMCGILTDPVYGFISAKTEEQKEFLKKTLESEEEVDKALKYLCTTEHTLAVVKDQRQNVRMLLGIGVAQCSGCKKKHPVEKLKDGLCFSCDLKKGSAEAEEAVEQLAAKTKALKHEGEMLSKGYVKCPKCDERFVKPSRRIPDKTCARCQKKTSSNGGTKR